MNPNDIIDALGGTAEVSRLCDVKMPSVSGWRKKGIPKSRLMFMKAVRPDVFKESAVPVNESGTTNSN